MCRQTERQPQAKAPELQTVPPRPEEPRLYTSGRCRSTLSFWEGCSALTSRGFENFDDLLPAQLLLVILNQNSAGKGIGLEIVDSQYAHQLTLKRLTKLCLAVNNRVFQPQAPGQLVLDFPVCDDRAVPEVTDFTVRITRRCDRRDSHRCIFCLGLEMNRHTAFLRIAYPLGLEREPFAAPTCPLEPGVTVQSIDDDPFELE